MRKQIEEERRKKNKITCFAGVICLKAALDENNISARVFLAEVACRLIGLRNISSESVAVIRQLASGAV